MNLNHEEIMRIISEYRKDDHIVQVAVSGGPNTCNHYARESDIKINQWSEWQVICQDAFKYIDNQSLIRDYSHPYKYYAEYYMDIIS